MKRALRSAALRSSSPSTRARRPPLPVVPGSASNAAVGNQLSRFSSQQHQHSGAAALASSREGCATRSVERRAAPPAWQPFAGDGGAGRGRGRWRGRNGGARFAPRSSRGAVATAAAALAAAVAAGAGGEQADCEYPEGTRFGDVYFCSGRALGSGECPHSFGLLNVQCVSQTCRRRDVAAAEQFLAVADTAVPAVM